RRLHRLSLQHRTRRDGLRGEPGGRVRAGRDGGTVDRVVTSEHIAAGVRARGLQALAFELLSAPGAHANAGVRSELVHVLAIASGSPGMVGGQALDLEAELTATNAALDVAHITRLQAMKTGALIRAACEMGAILGQASEDQRTALVRYGEALGFAFQISDDLLDAEGSAADVGKATGKDAEAGKATLVSLLGLPKARAHLDQIVAAAIAALEPFGDRGSVLAEAARFMGRRES
ncbi:MAG: polyprenyl synthetase family protein, partial [Hyphomicrobium sp.]